MSCDICELCGETRHRLPDHPSLHQLGWIRVGVLRANLRAEPVQLVLVVGILRETGFR